MTADVGDVVRVVGVPGEWRIVQTRGSTQIEVIAYPWDASWAPPTPFPIHAIEQVRRA